MNKFYQFATAVVAALSCSLAVSAQSLPLLELKQAEPIKHKGFSSPEGTTVITDGRVKAPAKINADDDPEMPVYHPKGEYASIGKGTYCEGLFTHYDAPSQKRWEVEIEESVEVPGWYRIQPYKDWNPITELIGECDPTYVYINATDPDFVWFEDMILYGGRFLFSQLVPENDWRGWAEYGILEDGVINMEDAWFCTFNYAYDRWEHCDDGFLALGLPGVKIPDYSLTAASEFHDDHNAPTIIYEKGEDIAAIYVATARGSIEMDYSTAQFVVENGDELPVETNYWIVTDLEKNGRGLYSVCLVGCNDRQEIVTATSTLVFVEIDNADEWEPLGRGYWQEGIVSPHIDGVGLTQLNVDIEKHKTIEGYYRLVNPLAEHPQLSEYLVENTGHNHYIYVNATDPDAVYLEASEIGLQTPNGQSAVWSYAGMCLENGMDVDYLKPFGFFGKMTKDGIITMPDDQLLYAETNYFGGRFVTSGDRFKIDLYHTVPSPAGIEDVAVDGSGAPVEYFNLQGIKVSNPGAGLYIRSQGGKQTKELIR